MTIWEDAVKWAKTRLADNDSMYFKNPESVKQ